MNHVKPTREELVEGSQKALEEAEKLKELDKEGDNEDETEQGDGQVEDNTQSDDTQETGQDDEADANARLDQEKDEKELEKKETEKTPEQIAQELKEKNEKLLLKNKASAQEAIILHSTNKKIQDSITQAADMPMPTDEEMIKEFPNWEDLDEFSQRMARDSVWNSRKIQAVTSVSQEFKDYKKWETAVTSYLDDPATITNIPLLDGREEAFKAFAMKPTRRFVNFDDLVKSFLYDDTQVKATHKGSMLDTTSEKPKAVKDTTKLTAEQGKQLRESDFKKWREYIRAGKIQTAL